MMALLLAVLPMSPLGARLAERAHAATGLKSVHQLSPAALDDCSGFVRAIYAREGIELHALPERPGENGVSNIRRLAAARRALRRRPRPGDLVFFRDTTQRKGLTHIGIVESVRGGEVTFAHRAGAGIVRSRLDLRHPHLRARNDVIRRGPGRPRLAGEQLAGFAAPEPLRPRARAGSTRWSG